MPEINQYFFDHKELVEILIKHLNIHEGRWMPIMNFGFSPGNFGPSNGEMAPGTVVAALKYGIQRAEANSPLGFVVDASEVNPDPSKVTSSSELQPPSVRSQPAAPDSSSQPELSPRGSPKKRRRS